MNYSLQWTLVLAISYLVTLGCWPTQSYVRNRTIIFLTVLKNNLRLSFTEFVAINISRIVANNEFLLKKCQA